MRLQERDINIINFIEEHKGITVQQAAALFFNGSIQSAYRRLRILKDNKQIKCDYSPFACSLVYYIKKMPSLHSLMLTAYYIYNIDNIANYKREVKAGAFIVDALVKFKSGAMAVVEAVAHKRVAEEKKQGIKQYFKAYYNIDINIIIITLYKMNDDRENITYSGIKRPSIESH